MGSPFAATKHPTTHTHAHTHTHTHTHTPGYLMCRPDRSKLSDVVSKNVIKYGVQQTWYKSQ